jgi:hypothetical protein
MIEAGTYTAVVDADTVDVGETSNGNDMISFSATLTDLGDSVKIYLVITEKTKDWVWKKLQAAGWDGEDLDALDGLGSKECTVAVKYEPWNGVPRMRADIVLPREPRKGGLAAKYGKVGSGFKL